jgi:hypothetical protein
LSVLDAVENVQGKTREPLEGFVLDPVRIIGGASAGVALDAFLTKQIVNPALRIRSTCT